MTRQTPSVQATIHVNIGRVSDREPARVASRSSTAIEGEQKAHASRIVIEVSGGVVQAMFADYAIGGDAVDMDNAKATSRQAVLEAEQFLEETRKTLTGVY